MYSILATLYGVSNWLLTIQRSCGTVLQSWMVILCFSLVLATCLLLAFWARTKSQLRPFWLFSKPYPSSSNHNRTPTPHLSNLLRKQPAGLDNSVVQSSLTEIQTGFESPMSQTLTAIVHSLPPKSLPGSPPTWPRQRDILPYWLQGRQRGLPTRRTQEGFFYKLDRDFPPLGSPKREHTPSGLQQLNRTSLSPNALQSTARKSKKIVPKSPVPLSFSPSPSRPDDTRVKQPYEAFLVLDIEGTCELGTDFNYPNEVIEFPVCLLQWTDRSDDGRAVNLEVVDEFHSYVKPTWRPILSDFCKGLTGITQDVVDTAPHFPEVLAKVETFLVKNGLIDSETKKRLRKFCWCSDGPCDIRDFVVKQCFISKIEMPRWLENDVLDIRSTVIQYLSHPTNSTEISGSAGLTTRSLNISTQLRILGLPTFEGREHSGIDDTRNVSRVLIQLARLGMCLLPNSTVRANKRWAWMGKAGQIFEGAIKPLK